MLRTVSLLLLALPWLNPFAPGPSPAVVPWLASLAAASGLLLLASVRSRHVANQTSFAQRWARPVAQAWLLAALISSVIGLLQYFGLTAALEPLVNRTSWPGEAFANLRQRNQFASLTNIALAALIWWVAKLSAAVTVDGQIAPRTRWWVTFAAALLAVGNAASASRTGALQLALVCALYAVWGGWRQPLVRRVLVVALLAYGLASLALPWVAGFDLWQHGMAARLRTGEEACASRLVLWSNVLHLIAQKPWLGWGWGELDYAHYTTLYNGLRFCDILDNAHNLPLQLAVELGVPFAVLVCGGFMWWALKQKPWRERDTTRQLAWSVMAVILLHSMLEYPLWYGPFQMAFGLCALMLWRQKQPLEAENSLKEASNSPLALIIQAQAAIFLIAITAYAAWDYHRISQIYLQPESRDAVYREGTLEKIRESRLFADQVRFAELILTPLTPANAAWTFNTASALLHFSPEPRVIEKAIESAVMLGRDDEALAQLARYRAAFPKEHARWAQAQKINGKPP